MCELCDRITNSLCKGMVARPDVLKGLIRTLADSNGLCGQGIMIFIEFCGWLNGAFYSFLRDNQALKLQVFLLFALYFANC